MTPLWSVDPEASFSDFVDRLASEPERQRERAECYAFIELLEKQGGILEGEETYLTYANGQQVYRGQFVYILYECMPDKRLVVLKDGCLPGEPCEFFDDTFREANDYAD